MLETGEGSEKPGIRNADRFIGTVVNKILEDMDRHVPLDGIYFFGFTFPLSLTPYLFHELRDFYCISTEDGYVIMGMPKDSAIPFLRHSKGVRLGIEVGGSTENLMKCAGNISLVPYAMAFERRKLILEESEPAEETYQ